MDANGGPMENRTPASAMRMPCNTTLLWAQIFFGQNKTDFRILGLLDQDVKTNCGERKLGLD